jgi:hypothetical protein
LTLAGAIPVAAGNRGSREAKGIITTERGTQITRGISATREKSEKLLRFMPAQKPAFALPRKQQKNRLSPS